MCLCVCACAHVIMLISVGDCFGTCIPFFQAFSALMIISIWTRSLSLAVGCKIVSWKMTKYQHYLIPVCQGCCLSFPGEKKQNKSWHMPNDTCWGWANCTTKNVNEPKLEKKKKPWQTHSSNNRYYLCTLEKKYIKHLKQLNLFFFFLCCTQNVVLSLLSWPAWSGDTSWMKASFLPGGVPLCHCLNQTLWW